MSARDNILARVRTQLGKDVQAREADAVAARAYIATHPRGPRLEFEDRNAVARFRERAEGLASTTDEITRREDFPAACARYLASLALAQSAVCWPEFAKLDWAGAGMQIDARPASGDDLTGITGTFCAIAETGTLMLLSGRDTHAVTSLLPETHIALVPASRIVRGMEDAWDLLRAERGKLPRNVNFVSGPSRTADIEQTIVIGAHGPYRVHLVILRDQ